MKKITIKGQKTGFWHPDNLRFDTHVLTSAACSGHPGSSVIGGKLIQQLFVSYESNKLCISPENDAQGSIWWENLNFHYSKCKILKTNPKMQKMDQIL